MPDSFRDESTKWDPSLDCAAGRLATPIYAFLTLDVLTPNAMNDLPTCSPACMGTGSVRMLCNASGVHLPILAAIALSFQFTIQIE